MRMNIIKFSDHDGDGHVANASVPVDVACAQFCSRKNISFFICGGKNLEIKNSMDEIFSEGTLVH